MINRIIFSDILGPRLLGQVLPHADELPVRVAHGLRQREDVRHLRVGSESLIGIVNRDGKKVIKYAACKSVFGLTVASVCEVTCCVFRNEELAINPLLFQGVLFNDTLLSFVLSFGSVLLHSHYQ